MIFPVVIHKDKRSDYGVTVPDLPGCFSAGETLQDALTMAREAIELHLEGLIAEGQLIPAPGSIDQHAANPDFKGGTWALVAIDESNLRVQSVRINITLPERTLAAMDSYASKIGETRSGLISHAVVAYMGRTHDELPKAKRGRPTRRGRVLIAKPAKQKTK